MSLIIPITRTYTSGRVDHRCRHMRCRHRLTHSLFQYIFIQIIITLFITLSIRKYCCRLFRIDRIQSNLITTVLFPIRYILFDVRNGKRFAKLFCFFFLFIWDILIETNCYQRFSSRTLFELKTKNPVEFHVNRRLTLWILN